MGDGMLSLSWNNHSTTFCHMLSSLRQKERYTDATVACEGKFYPVHQLVLSTCSQYFEEMFEHTTGKHPVVLLHDVRRYELEALLNYMYAGIVSVAQRDLARLIKVAELLQIKGLAVPDELPGDKKNVINSHNTNRDSPSPKSKLIRGTESSDDRSSPHPKRLKREERGSSPHLRQAPPHTPDSPTTPHDINHDNSKISYSSHDQDLEELDKSGESNLLDDSINEDQKQINSRQEARTAQQRVEHQVNDRYLHQSVSQDSPRNQYRVKDGGEDAIVIKEEAWEDAGEHHREESEADYMSEDTAPRPGEASQEDPTSLLLAKEYEGQVHQLPPALPEVVVEALAGPSGMHQWLGGAEFGSGGTDSYGGDGGSPPPADASHLQQMAREETEGSGGGGAGLPCTPRLHHCSFCSYSTPRKDHLTMHVRTHTGERPFVCPYCPSRFGQKGTLNNHIRTHTGEKPYSCPTCTQSFTRNSHLKSHMATHTFSPSSF